MDITQYDFNLKKKKSWMSYAERSQKSDGWKGTVLVNVPRVISREELPYWQ